MQATNTEVGVKIMARYTLSLRRKIIIDYRISVRAKLLIRLIRDIFRMVIKTHNHRADIIHCRLEKSKACGSPQSTRIIQNKRISNLSASISISQSNTILQTIIIRNSQSINRIRCRVYSILKKKSRRPSNIIEGARPKD